MSTSERNFRHQKIEREIDKLNKITLEIKMKLNVPKKWLKNVKRLITLLNITKIKTLTVRYAKPSD